MAIPLNAKQWSQEMDPSDELEWILDVAGLLEPGEAIASWTLDFHPQAVDLGLTLGTGPRAPTRPSPTKFLFWFTIHPDLRNDTRFDGQGALLPMEMTIETTSVPSRTIQKTVMLRSAQQ